MITKAKIIFVFLAAGGAFLYNALLSERVNVGTTIRRNLYGGNK